MSEQVQSSSALQQYVDANKKAQWVGMVLVLFFGPLGLFYAGWRAAVILTLGVGLSFVGLGIIGLVVWVVMLFVCMAVSYSNVNSHNQKIIAKAKLVQSGMVLD